MRSLFVMDPLERINLAGDSTFMLMRETSARGWDAWWCTPRDLFTRDGRGWARAQQVRTAAGFHPGPTRDEELAGFDVVWMRKDPPFDMDYVVATHLLDFVPHKTLVLNAPNALRARNEKLFAASFPDLAPPTLVSQDSARIVAFAAEMPDRIVLKPLDGNGGRGVLVTRSGDPNLRSMIELLSDEGRRHIIAQRHVPEIVDGDKRILLVDGEPVGAVSRVPGPHDHRGNIHVGATVAKATLTARDQEICARLRPACQAEGLLFVGIDVIGPHLTEINVTSPTGIQEINRLDDTRIEVRVLDAALRRHLERRGVQ